MFVEIEKEYLNTEKPILPFVLCTYGKMGNQNAVSRRNGFKYHHVLWAAGGEGTLEVDGNTYTLKAGDGIFCKRGVAHAYRATEEPFETYWITFIVPQKVLDFYSVPDWFLFRVTPGFQSVVRELDRLCAEGDIVSRSAAGYSWFVEWMSGRRSGQLDGATQIKHILENRFAENLSLDVLADSVGLDRFSLCRAYKKEYGITVMEQLKRIRIAKAKQLLRFSELDINEIGKSCGITAQAIL